MALADHRFVSVLQRVDVLSDRVDVLKHLLGVLLVR